MKDSSLDDELDKRLRSMFNDLTEEQFVVRIKELITKREREAYKKGYINKGIEELNTSEGGKQ